MTGELWHECGLAALARLDGVHKDPARERDGVRGGDDVGALLPRVLLDVQNRGQLAAGMTAYRAGRAEPLVTFKDVGSVQEAFRMTDPERFAGIVEACSGVAAIGHTRYATSGPEDGVRYAQPLERRHGRLWKWFSLAFNGNIANYAELRDRLLAKGGYHFTLDTDAELLLHLLAYQLRAGEPPDLVRAMSEVASELDGAYNLAFLDAVGRLFVSRDPLGLRPLCYAVEDGLFAAANESVALANLGFRELHHLEPGEMAVVDGGRVRVARYAAAERRARCFFEWVYFSNVASEIDGIGVYRTRANIGRLLADLEDQPTGPDTVVVPVPDTAKAAADAYAYELGVPCMEGVIRNRYVGRTFIQPAGLRSASAASKYATIPEILAGRRVFLIEDSIVRSLTLSVLADQLRADGAREIHVRVGCPPIIGPCFYGISIPTSDELFAAGYLDGGDTAPSAATLATMARQLGVDTLRYLPVAALADGLDTAAETLCLGCVTRRYPTPAGNAAVGRAAPEPRSVARVRDSERT